jgi:uncharacterized iron-regulated membrane protein
MCVTGLVIMYTEPIQGWLSSGATRVARAGHAPLGLSAQQVVADQVAPQGATLFRIVTPKAPDRVSEFYYSAGPPGVPYFELPDGDVTYVYVDPYRSTVTATGHPGDDIVGLANRLHGFLNNDALKIPLRSISHLVDPAGDPDGFVQVEVGDLIIEIAMGWALVLALSGLYLWWPRASQKGKRLLIPRLRKKGRLRWRDLHAATGILGMAVLVIFITTGMPWSSYWGKAWSAVGNALTPGTTVEASSSLPKAGDLDRFGHHTSWATLEDRVSASQPVKAPESGHLHQGGIHGGSGAPATRSRASGEPARLSLDDVAQAVRLEGLKPGYSILLPVDTSNQNGKRSYGSYQLSNPWPDRLSAERTVYLDQFTGEKLAQKRHRIIWKDRAGDRTRRAHSRGHTVRRGRSNRDGGWGPSRTGQHRHLDGDVVDPPPLWSRWLAQAPDESTTPDGGGDLRSDYRCALPAMGGLCDLCRVAGSLRDPPDSSASGRPRPGRPMRGREAGRRWSETVKGASQGMENAVVAARR